MTDDSKGKKIRVSVLILWQRKSPIKFMKVKIRATSRPDLQVEIKDLKTSCENRNWWFIYAEKNTQTRLKCKNVGKIMHGNNADHQVT